MIMTMTMTMITIDKPARSDQHSYPRASPTVKWTFLRNKNDDEMMMMGKFEMVLNSAFPFLITVCV